MPRGIPDFQDFTGGAPAYRQGDTIADLIMRRGQLAADAERRGGEIWSNVLGGVTQTLAEGIKKRQKEQDDEETSHAARLATSDQYPSATKPGPVGSGAPIDPGSYDGPPGMTPDMSGRGPDPGSNHLAAILDSMSPENRPAAEAKIASAQASAAKLQEAQLTIAKAAQDLKEKQTAFQQQTADHWFGVAKDAEPHFADADGGISAFLVGGLASSGVPGADQIKQFALQGAQAMRDAAGDPEKQQAIAEAFRAQAKPLVDRAISNGSLAAQKTYAETRKLNEPAGVPLPEGSTLVDPRSGAVIAKGAPKPETRTLEEQLAAAQLAGDTETVGKLLRAKSMEAAAGRDPDAAANRAAARTNADNARNDARLDKSYQFNSQQLEASAKPLTDQADRFARLVSTVNQKTPQADALVAPELLTVMAGGAGSGLRMNEAEISRVVGGRSAFENLKAALQHYNPDSGKALSITDAQREQITKLIAVVHDRLQSKVDAISEARQQLVDAPDVESHRRIVTSLKSKLGALENGGAAAGPVAIKTDADYAALPSGAEFIAPDGSHRRKP